MTSEQSTNEIPSVSLTRRFFRLLAGNILLLLGLALLGGIIAFTVFGYLFVDLELARLNSAPISQPPSWEHWFGTDAVGRSILALLVIGTPKTLLIGLLAGVCGITIGTCLGFFAGIRQGLGGYGHPNHLGCPVRHTDTLPARLHHRVLPGRCRLDDGYRHRSPFLDGYRTHG